MFFTANENSILTYNLTRTQYQVSGSSHCSASINTRDESADKKHHMDYCDFHGPACIRKVYILATYIIGHNSPNVSKQSTGPHEQKVYYGLVNTKRVIIHNSSFLQVRLGLSWCIVFRNFFKLYLTYKANEAN